MNRLTPTARSLKYLRKNNCIAEKVEQRLPIPDKWVTRDLFNCFDIVAIHPFHGIIGVQSTTIDHMSHRRKKIVNEPMMAAWLRAGGKIHLHGWKGFELREEEIRFNDKQKRSTRRQKRRRHPGHMARPRTTRENS